MPFLLLLGVNFLFNFKVILFTLLPPLVAKQLALENGIDDSWYNQLTDFFVILSVSHFFWRAALPLPIPWCVSTHWALSWLFFSIFTLSYSPVITTTPICPLLSSTDFRSNFLFLGYYHLDAPQTIPSLHV